MPTKKQTSKRKPRPRQDFVPLMVRVLRGKRKQIQEAAAKAGPKGVSVNTLVNRFIDRGLKEKARAR